MTGSKTTTSPHPGDHWRFARVWRIPRGGLLGDGWGRVASFHAAGRALAQRRVEELRPLRAEWDQVLQELGGDASRVDWRSFRPLRLSREEDWSDWLAHLLACSTTGSLGSQLTGRSADACIQPEVAREECAEGSRLDLVVHWRAGLATHIEVKVGDLALEKTFGSAADLETVVGRGPLQHFILLPEPDLVRWYGVAASKVPGHWPQVDAITWTAVAVALRRCLLARHEDLSWRVWARTFLGAVEQRVLHHPRWDPQRAPLDTPETLDVIAVLKEALSWKS